MERKTPALDENQQALIQLQQSGKITAAEFKTLNENYNQFKEHEEKLAKALAQADQFVKHDSSIIDRGNQDIIRQEIKSQKLSSTLFNSEIFFSEYTKLKANYDAAKQRVPFKSVIERMQTGEFNGSRAIVESNKVNTSIRTYYETIEGCSVKLRPGLRIVEEKISPPDKSGFSTGAGIIKFAFSSKKGMFGESETKVKEKQVKKTKAATDQSRELPHYHAMQLLAFAVRKLLNTESFWTILTEKPKATRPITGTSTIDRGITPLLAEEKVDEDLLKSIFTALEKEGKIKEICKRAKIGDSSKFSEKDIDVQPQAPEKHQMRYRLYAILLVLHNESLQKTENPPSFVDRFLKLVEDHMMPNRAIYGAKEQ